MSVWTIVVAAGHGERFGGDKQAADLGGRPVVAHSVAAATGVSDGVVVVVAPERLAAVEALALALAVAEALAFVEALASGINFCPRPGF